MTAFELFFLALTLGLGTGLVLGLTGAGGAILATPLLMIVFHLPMPAAVPIALLAVCLAASVGSILGLRQGVVRYRAAMLMACFGAVLAPVGVWLGGVVPPRPLHLLFIALLCFITYRAFAQAKADRATSSQAKRLPPPPCVISPTDGRFQWNAPCAVSLAGSGGLAGLLSGMLGVGGGFVIVPAMRRFTNAPMHSIVGTSLMVIAISSLSGLVTVVSSGKMDWTLAQPFALGAVLGLVSGRKLSHFASPARLQQGFGVIVVVILLLMLKRFFAA